MLNFDHLVLHANNTDQVLSFKSKLKEVRIPYEPSWGKKAKGFQISNIWIGKQYFEIVDILKNKNSWQPSWSNRHNKGDRGTFCIFLKTNTSIDEIYEKLANKGVLVTQPERTTFKWFFNLLEKKLPWRFFLTTQIPGTDIELGFIEYDEGAEAKFSPFMVPNSSEVGITGISHVTLLTRDLESAKHWLDELQNTLDEKISFTFEQPSNDVAVKLDLETSGAVEFKAVKIFDVLLRSNRS